MGKIKLEVVTIDEQFEGTKQDAEVYVQNFLKESGDIVTTEYTDIVDKGDIVDRRFRTYGRKSEIFWTSIAILLISNPEGVVQFLQFVRDIPGLTMGFTVEGDVRIKIFPDVDFTLIDQSTNYNIQKIGEVNGDVVVRIPEEDWIQLYDDIYTDELDIDMPPEDQIGL